ncbi:hypothetical protein SAMN06265371_104143 [Lutibacter agarilyticus]|uniref:Uncharacterized protein n=1 Tax=Lutibacter agarilyticus TaxID=1109740 RepID=A0A238WWI4_9FLAO|nr:hypothetical protein [Lutibacter agarilyticus]SNR50995.1 hypothetical protein SAMN06265371_104143 [Lutibacter agarilyticus]
MKLKKKCFIGLGGAGRNALVYFIEKEKNAEFMLFDAECTTKDDKILDYEGKYSEQIVNIEKLDAITNQFSKDKSYVLLASLSYSEFRKKASTALVKHIALYFYKNNYDFKIVLTTPLIFEYNAVQHLKINKIKLEIESLGETIIVNLDEYLKKYGDYDLVHFTKFHYIAWKNVINKI